MLTEARRGPLMPQAADWVGVALIVSGICHSHYMTGEGRPFNSERLTLTTFPEPHRYPVNERQKERGKDAPAPRCGGGAGSLYVCGRAEPEAETSGRLQSGRDPSAQPCKESREGKGEEGEGNRMQQPKGQRSG